MRGSLSDRNWVSTMNQVENMRQFYRLETSMPLCSLMEIIRIKDNAIQSGKAKVCVDDISGGGLKFVTDLQFLVEERVVFQFELQLLNETFKTQGVIVRKRKLDDDLNEYGVQFTMEDSVTARLTQTINQLSVLVQRTPHPSSCTFCDQKERRGCFK